MPVEPHDPWLHRVLHAVAWHKEELHKPDMQIEINTSLRTPTQAPKLAALAAACHNGACNVGGLLRSVSEAAAELPAGEAKDHPAVKLILGQLSYLCKESVGPTSEAIHEYEAWRDQVVSPSTSPA